jgi:hypothetical protein
MPNNPGTVSYQLAAAVSNGIAQAQTPAAAGPLTLNGSLVTAGVATMDTARRVLVNSTGNDANVIFTVVGTDRNGNVQSSPVTGLNVGNGFTALDFLTVTAVNSSAATVGVITVGTNGFGSTSWQVDDFLARDWALSVWLTGPAGTTYTLETTIDDPNAQAGSGISDQEQFSMHPGCFVPPKAWPDPIIDGVSGDNRANYPGNPIFAHRFTITGGTGKVFMQSIQATVGSGA